MGKFTRDHLCQSFLFNKSASPRAFWPAALLKVGLKTLRSTGVFKFCKIFKNTFFSEHLRTNASVEN